MIESIKEFNPQIFGSISLDYPNPVFVDRTKDMEDWDKVRPIMMSNIFFTTIKI